MGRLSGRRSYASLIGLALAGLKAYEKGRAPAQLQPRSVRNLLLLAAAANDNNTHLLYWRVIVSMDVLVSCCCRYLSTPRWKRSQSTLCKSSPGLTS